MSDIQPIFADTAKSTCMFDIQALPFGKFTSYKLINQQSGEYVVIVPEVGANVIEMVLKSKDTLCSVLQGYLNDEALDRHNGYRSSRLLPFPNRIRDGNFVFNGESHQLTINRAKEGHAIHGLFYKSNFVVGSTIAGPHDAVLSLHLDYKGNLPGYPFHFRAGIEYKLHEGGFESSLRVLNTGDAPLPFGDGWHPYFKLNGDVNDLYLTLPQAEEMAIDQRKIPTGVFQSFTPFSKRQRIGEIQLDNGLRLQENGTVVTELYHKKTDVKLSVWQETGPSKYNYLQVYIPKTRDAVAIEPMTCAANAFNNSYGLITLKPGEEFEAKFGVYLE
ncbi:MAG: aldose 1-epimerase [Bacteroidetes bacterium]|nr:aldose 1-epimerase [Bacteroidota bacterium]